MEFYDRMYNMFEYICALYENVLEVWDDMKLYDKTTINLLHLTSAATSLPVRVQGWLTGYGFLIPLS